MKILITGSYGFIGTNLVNYFLNKKIIVYGIDNFSNYSKLHYTKRLNFIKKNKYYKNYKFFKIDLIKKINSNIIKDLDFIIHLAAQPGVQYSKINKKIYIEKNLIALTNILDFSVKKNADFLFASSSSVYGNETIQSETSNLRPESIYGFTKKFGEELASHYSKIHNLKTISLRFFTVYGPFGRPDMAYYLFLKKIFLGKKITVYNFGKNKRSFTYIDDITESIFHIIKKKIKNKNLVLNIGNPKNYSINNLIQILKKLTKRKIRIHLTKKISQDPISTKANLKKYKLYFGKKSFVNLKTGMKKFYDWYIEK